MSGSCPPLEMLLPVVKIVSTINRMGQKSKLVILSVYVNKTEKIGGTLTTTNSYGENEAVSDIFT